MKKYLARVKRNIYRSSLKMVDTVLQTDYYWDYTFRANGYHDNHFKFSHSKIAFVHIPKTGGTSFYKLLQNDPDNRFINLEVHRPISIYCPPSDYSYITIMRDPVDRVWSLYQMVLRHPKGYPYQKYAAKGLHVFLKNCWEANDLVCRYFTGEVDQQPNQGTLLKASQNLNLFHAILSFDNFQTEVKQFLEKYKIDNKYIPHERKHKYISPTNEERAMIASYNKYDVLLFEEWSKKRNNG